MRNPRLEILLVEKMQVRANHKCQSLGALHVRHGLREESRIVVAQDIVVPRFVEVLVFLRSVEPILLPESVVCRFRSRENLAMVGEFWGAIGTVLAGDREGRRCGSYRP